MAKLEAQQPGAVNYTPLPEGLRDGMQRWIEAGIQPGSFLSALIVNNAFSTFANADTDNRAKLHEIVMWFYYHCPTGAWGNYDKAQKWAKRFSRTFDWRSSV